MSRFFLRCVFIAIGCLFAKDDDIKTADINGGSPYCPSFSYPEIIELIMNHWDGHPAMADLR